ncbi:MAG TPA: hypothetical protein VKD72_02785 [Gemmataceae bacterium]|nr:hypothetical protein [Gemmataceae bacterium]
MFTTRRWIGFSLAGALLALVPGSLCAQNLILRNDTQTAVLVRPMSVFMGAVRRDRPILLNPKASTLPPITLPGDRIIIIYDANVPTRMLYKGTLPANPPNVAYAIQPDLPPPRVKLVPIPYPGPGGP